MSHAFREHDLQPGANPSSASPAGGACVCGERAVELVSRVDVELREDLVQVVLDSAAADEQLGADLGVGEAVAGKPRDLGLLRGKLVEPVGRASPRALTGRQQLAGSADGESNLCTQPLHGHLVQFRRTPRQ